MVTRGYSIDFFTLVWKYNNTSFFLICPDMKLSAHFEVFWWRRRVCLLEDPSDDIHTPRILEACACGSIFIRWWTSYVSRERWSLFFARCHVPAGSQVNSMSYHLFFLKLTCPPVALVAPANILRPSWESLTLSYVGVSGEGGIWTIV